MRRRRGCGRRVSGIIALAIVLFYVLSRRRESWTERPSGVPVPSPSVKSISVKSVNEGALSDRALPLTVEVWGKAAVVHYLWEYILDATYENRLGGVWQYGEKSLSDPVHHSRPIKFILRMGVGVVPHKVPKRASNILLVLNGREARKVSEAKKWLNEIQQRRQRSSSVPRVILLLHGSETCDNLPWLEPYLPLLSGILLVYYDINLAQVARQQFPSIPVHEWPLGVAAYRHFPTAALDEHTSLSRPCAAHDRDLLCGFVGTVYDGSTRVLMQQVIGSHPILSVACHLRTRTTWQVHDTPSESIDHLSTLRRAWFTLCPAGAHPLSYRIFEAASQGSIPIVERPQPSQQAQKCHGDAAFALLESTAAPVLYIDSWSSLPSLRLDEWSTKRLCDHQRRVRVWYASLRPRMQQRLLSMFQ